MASATVDHRNHLHIESIPVVDLRLLSQPDLLSLALCSSSPSPSNAETELFTPKIDRSVFNESAGSRKQTFFRLRFAAPRSHLHHQHSSPPSEPFPSRSLYLNPESLDEESSNALSLLKSLFNIDDSLPANPEADEPYDDKDLVPVQIEYPNGNSGLQNIPVDIVSSSLRKRKRGRPRRDGKDNWLIESEPLAIEEYKEMKTFDRPNETADAGNSSSCNEGKRRRGRPRREESQSRVIASGEKKVESEIEKAAFVNVEAILGIEEELRRRTEGIVTEVQLLEFMKGLEGEWASKSQKKRIIDAAGFGNVLPKGWKLMLFVKKRAGHCWLACSRYISPNGQQFVSCKEVSSYLLSFGGLKGSSVETLSHADNGIDLGVKPTPGNLPITCRSSENEKRAPLLKIGSPREVQRAETIKCHKCTMTFNLQDDFICHLLSSHKGSAMSSGHGTPANEEVKIKNGKYECQFCHQLFEERNCYSSHLGIHMENNMKKVEGSVGEQSTVQPLNSAGSNEIGPGFRCSESNENALVETFTDKYNHEGNLLSHDEQDKVNMNEKVLADRNCDTKSKLCFVTDNKRDITDATAAADLNVCLGSENILFTSEKEGISRPSDKIDVGFAVNSMEEKKREMALNTSFLAPNAKGNMFSDENTEDGHFPSFLKGMEVDLKDKATRDDPKAGCADTSTELSNVRIDTVQGNYSEGCSLIPSGNKQRVNLVDHLKGASVTIDSTHERGSGCGLSSSKGDQTCVINNSLILVSGTLDDPGSIMVNESANIDPTICFQSHLPMKKPSQEKSETVLLTSHGREQIFPSDNNAFKAFSRTVEVSELDGAQNYRGLSPGVNSRNSGVDPNILASVKHEKTKDHLFGLSSYKKTHTCTPEYKQDKGSESILYQQYGNQQNSNYETSMNKVSFFSKEEPKHKGGSSIVGNAYARVGAFALTGIVQESCSPHFSGNREKISGKNNVPGISSGAVLEPKQNKGAFEDFFGLSSSEQTHVANNLNMVHAGTAHDGSRLQDFQNARNNEIMIGYSNHARPIEDSMTGLTWKSNEGNVLLSGLADTSSQLLTSSGYYPTFDWMSHKGQSEMFNISGKCSNESGLSDNLEHMEYSFMTAQPSSRSGNSKVPSYGSEMALKFDSVWLGKDALPLLPKIAGRHQVTTLCSWCGNQFYNEAVDIAAQRSTMVMCANCRARFSRDHDFIRPAFV
ncbi:Methyl-CpG-binding domain-containing protein 8 [Gossypium australe]|uniref:Methyl-CpG-binding domain-containing protein 8 n=1 Tax=Gossypium australe TaxID=47621 RepID=A0A5B6VGJ6_9ROSI|nr:Methyl-CpG-binding domain-containing protein 8 [Gossypium australe]